MGRRGYSPEFDARFDLLEAGRKVADVARDLGVSNQTVYSWRNQDPIGRGLEPGLSSTQHHELALALPQGSIKATVLLETILAAFEIDEILYELRDRSAGINAGRWDYIFSIIKKFRHRDDFVLPDRNQVTMTVPFMRAYTELLVKTCHRRGAHAIGGMAAFIPSRKDPSINETAFAKVWEDKAREAADGFDGS